MANQRDQFSVQIVGGNRILVTIEHPADALVAQRYLWQALMAGTVAAELQPLKCEIEVTPDGSIVGSASAAYHGWSADPRLDEHVETMTTVVSAALESYGYRLEYQADIPRA